MSQEKTKLSRRPFLLIIRDGWGYNSDSSDDKNNPLKIANTPTEDMLTSQYPHCLINTYGEEVGLPEGTMGNSEVGHQNIGAGRIVAQESVRLTFAIKDGSFFNNPEFLNAITHVKKTNGKLHVMGLCSDIGVHSRLEHLYGILETAKRQNFSDVYIHAFTDGRDSPPTSGSNYIKEIEAKAAEIGIGKIASVTGRFYAMDRDSRWDRVQQAYDCLRNGKGNKAQSAASAIQDSYNEEVTDEFIKPTYMTGDNGKPLATIDDGDAVIFFNFRGDRPRELTRAFVDSNFEGFDRTNRPDVYYICMTEYAASIDANVAFKKTKKMKNTLGGYWSDLGLKQFRCAETEKYAHVTFFFNDYREEPFAGEDRQIVPSPKVTTYDLQPEMSALEVCDTVLAKLDSQKYDTMIINFANCDMVGHTGIMEATIKAVETVDSCVGKILAKVKSLGGAAVVTADHGNAEKIWDSQTNQPFTSHTTGQVPLIVFDEKNKNRKLTDGILADIAPTLLAMMELDQPVEMTGKNLLADAD